MKINLKAKNIELTDSLKEYVHKKVASLEKLLGEEDKKGSEAIVHFEVGRSTEHHKLGDVFHADCVIHIAGEKFYASADEEDLYRAIDQVREILFRDISKKNGRKQTLFIRGAISVKKMMKGLSKRNPFTSKY